MWKLFTLVVVGYAAFIPHGRADVQVKGFPGSGSAAGQLSFPGARFWVEIIFMVFGAERQCKFTLHDTALSEMTAPVRAN